MESLSAMALHTATAWAPVTALHCRSLLRLLRPHQWTKNILLFVPLLLGHEFTIATLGTVLAAVAVFSMFASTVYVLNDRLDVEADRLHPTKRQRPLASGALPLGVAVPLAILLLSLGSGLAWSFLPTRFLALAALYLTASIAYSVWLKRKPVVDVILLAGLYTIRILAGGAAAEVAVTEWLLAFSMFFFVSLAFAKRYAELDRHANPKLGLRNGRGYDVSDIGLLETLGPTSGYLAVLVFSLYIQGETAQQLYTREWALWLICPLILYWISRVWLLAKRHKLLEDPVVFAMTDRVSLAVGAGVGALLLLAHG